MKVLHLMTGGGLGGIQTLIKQYSDYSKCENVFVFAYNDGPYYTELVNQGNQVYLLKGDNSLKKIFSVIRILREEKPTVVVEHFCAPFLRLLLLISKTVVPGTKTVIYQHHDAGEDGSNAFGIKRKILRRIDGAVCGQVDEIYAISNFVKSSLINNYSVKMDKIHVIYNGVNLERFSPEKNNDNEIIYVGRLIEEKGVQVILHALSKIKEDYHFSVVGDGPYRYELEKMAQELDVKSKVTFYGAQKDVNKYLNRANIFVHVPLLEEGFGITVVEAMAAGTNVITTYSGGIPEIITDGVNGHMVVRNDTDSLAERMRDVLLNYNAEENIEIRRQAIVDSRKYSIEEFSEQLDTLLCAKISK